MVLTCGTAIVLAMEHNGNNVARWIRKQCFVLRWTVYYAAAVSILFFAAFGQSAFIYQQLLTGGGRSIMPTQTPASAPRGTQKVNRSAVADPGPQDPPQGQKKSASSPHRHPKKPNIFVRFLHGLVRRLYFGSKTLFKFALFIPILVFMVWFSYTVDRSGLFQGELDPPPHCGLDAAGL